MSNSQHYYSSSEKERVVNYYNQNKPNCSFRSVAKKFNLRGGHELVRRWYKNRRSLETKLKPGRPTILSRREISNHIQTKIRAANRSSTPIHYTSLLNSVNTATNKKISLRTLQRYGKRILGAKQKRTVKRTVEQCENSRTIVYHNYLLF